MIMVRGKFRSNPSERRRKSCGLNAQRPRIEYRYRRVADLSTWPVLCDNTESKLDTTFTGVSIAKHGVLQPAGARHDTIRHCVLFTAG